MTTATVDYLAELPWYAVSDPDEPTPLLDALIGERDADCRWEVGPIPKLDGHTCHCNRLRWHPLPHTCDCGSWFEGCGRDAREAPRPCDTCGSIGDDPCRTKGGRALSTPHVGRGQG